MIVIFILKEVDRTRGVMVEEVAANLCGSRFLEKVAREVAPSDAFKVNAGWGSRLGFEAESQSARKYQRTLSLSEQDISSCVVTIVSAFVLAPLILRASTSSNVKA